MEAGRISKVIEDQRNLASRSGAPDSETTPTLSQQMLRPHAGLTTLRPCCEAKPSPLPCLAAPRSSPDRDNTLVEPSD